jgi:acetyltransferase-like isoleucine patch superfamily enzyme
MRKLVLIVAVLLPQQLKALIYRRVFRWQIGKNVRIGLSYIEGRKVILRDGVTIGHFNVFRGLKQLIIGQETYIANFNECFGSGYGPEWPGELHIGANVNVMSHHFLDVGGQVTIGSRAVIGGRDSQIWSHQLGLVEGVLRLMPLRVCVGEDVYVGARAMLLGCSIPAGAVVGAGSVVTRDFEPQDCRVLIAGNPATIIKRYEEESGRALRGEM